MSADQHFLIALMRAGRTWRRIADAAAAEFGLTEATALPLLYLTRMEHGPRQAALAEAMQIERPSVAWLMDQLSGLGMIERREDPGDRRAKRIFLTKKGRTATTHIQGALERQRQALFAAIDRDDLHICLRILETIAKFGGPSPDDQDNEIPPVAADRT